MGNWAHRGRADQGPTALRAGWLSSSCVAYRAPSCFHPKYRRDLDGGEGHWGVWGYGQRAGAFLTS